MIAGNQVFLKGEMFDGATHKRLRKTMEMANLPLQFFFYEQVGENPELESKDEKHRFLWLGHIALVIMGASTPDNEDYVRVSKGYVMAAQSPQTSFDRDYFKNYKPSFDEALSEAEYYFGGYNDYLNECEKTSFDADKLWRIFYDSVGKAYALAMLKKMLMDGTCDSWKTKAKME